MLARASCTSSAKGAWGRRERQESVTAASRWRSRVRRSMALVVRQAGHCTHRNQYRAAVAAPIVGENSKGIRWAWRSFQAQIRPLSVRKHLGIGCATGCCFSVGLGALSFHFAAVEAHVEIVAEWADKSMCRKSPDAPLF
jgi:hypothetical protein